MPALTRKPRPWFRPDPDQPRKFFDPDELMLLGQSMKDIGQQVPLQAKADGTIIDGERRWRAADLAGIAELDVVITDVALSPAEVQIIRLSSFFHRVDLSYPEKTDALAELLQATGWTNRELAEHLHVHESGITRILCPLKLIPEGLASYRKGELSVSDCYELYKKKPEAQLAALTAKLSGAVKNRAQLAAHGNTVEQPPDDDKDQAATIRMQMAGGISITIKGKALSLDKLAELLLKAHREATAAKKDGLTAKTAQSLWKDRSRHAAAPQPAAGGA